MVSSGECVTNELGDDKLQERKAPEGEIHAEQPISHNELDAPRTGQEHAAAAEDPRKAPVLDVVVHSMDKDNGGGNISRESEKTPKAADVRPIASFGPEANAYAIPEKVPEDGYNWRKYGQKLVKGNEFVRSYYKCTHLNCHVKKQLERSHDGRITDTVYFGEHDHPKPLDHGLVEKEKSSNAQSHTPRQNRVALTSQPLPATPAEDFKAPPQSNKSSSEVVGTADDPSSKRRKKENNNVDVTPVEKPSNDMRTVVRTLSDVDLVNDGYRWRKYGQKLVKGSPHPRSYYRCSSPGCPVKKHVERASHDDKMVITTYEGHHDHDLPPARTVTPNISSPNFHTTVQKEGTGTRSEGNDSVLHKVASHSGSYPHSENKSELLNGESRAKLEPSRHDVEEVNTAASVPVRRSSEGEGVKSEINKA